MRKNSRQFDPEIEYEGYGNDISEYKDDDLGYDTASIHQEEELDEEDEYEEEELEDRKDSSFLLNADDNFYKTHDSEEIHANFKSYVMMANSDDPEMRKTAWEWACRDLEGFIIYIMNRKFGTYIEKDKTFSDDLMQAGRQGIIMTLEKYDPDKSKPTTYFFNPIKHEMVSLVNQMKHDTKSHMATAKRKIQQIDKEFAQYGRKATIHDYVYITGDPWKRIVNALAEMKISNTKSSIDDPESAPLIDSQISIRGSEENALDNYNAERILAIVDRIEPDVVIRQCFRDYTLNDFKPPELAAKYNRSVNNIMDGIKNILNLIKYDSEMKKMYPERLRRKEDEFIENINTIPVEEGDLAMEDVLKSLQYDMIEQENDELNLLLG